MDNNLTIIYKSKLDTILNGKNIKWMSYNPKVTKFKNELYDDNVEYVIPLNKQETMILRKLVGTGKHVNLNIMDFCNLIQIERNVLSSRINEIFHILSSYFSRTNDNVTYNSSVNELNSELTIFDADFMQYTQNILRILGCVYLKDITHYSMSEISSYLSEDEFKKLLNVLGKNDLLFDEQSFDFIQKERN